MRTFISSRPRAFFARASLLERQRRRSSDEATLERHFDALIHPERSARLDEAARRQPNHVGSPHDKANADQILAWFKGWGWDAHIETF